MQIDAVFMLCRKILHPVGLAQQGHHQIDIVNIDVHQAAGLKIGVKNIGLFSGHQGIIAGGILAERSIHHLQLAHLGHVFLDPGKMGVVQGGNHLEQVQSLFLCQFDQFPGLPAGGHKGFLAQYVLAMLQRLLHMGIVKAVGRCDIDKIQFRIAAQTVQIGVDLVHAEFIRQFPAGFIGAGVDRCAFNTLGHSHLA